MLADILSLVDGFVRDESSRLTAGDKESAVTLAVARYGKDRPRHKVEDVASAGGDTLPLPLSWNSESVLTFAEYPIGEMPPVPLYCTLYSAPSGDVFRLGESLSIGAEVRLTFTVPHVVSAVLDTIPPGHREAVSAYAAALLLEALAAASINDGESTILADTTDRRTKAQEYAARARALKNRYSDAVGLANGAVSQASGTTVSWGSRSRLVGRRLHHG